MRDILSLVWERRRGGWWVVVDVVAAAAVVNFIIVVIIKIIFVIIMLMRMIIITTLLLLALHTNTTSVARITHTTTCIAFTVHTEPTAPEQPSPCNFIFKLPHCGAVFTTTVRDASAYVPLVMCCTRHVNFTDVSPLGKGQDAGLITKVKIVTIGNLKKDPERSKEGERRGVRASEAARAFEAVQE